MSAAPPNDADYEAELMQAAQIDPAQFAPLYERYFDRVYAYCLRRSANAQEAEDLCSQVFAKALTGLPSYRGGMVAAWLFRIAHNVVVNHYRGRTMTVTLDEAEPADDGLFDHAERADDRRILGALVADLPSEQRNLLALTVDAGLTSQAAGDILGKSAGAVRVQLHRLLRQLRERYVSMTGERP
jgi:RNA polymerase sigma-70 factor (ECF subfamily)